ncbi:glycosyltransferase involved in cell wall biosynthesis [Fictibacillus halophilus]|uniref:Glycosyltransferase involved in cell wall biosynthesis n=1 Tax=Fictibacillus halophilus TaxID=1610490 RepID=A0ABV2LKR2_9BACL|nr:glycosyltransferase [Fictibacillus halophilus]
MDKVSIVIPFYNCTYVSHAIQSALDQTYNNIEIIVVNDGSFQHNEKLEPYRDRVTILSKPNGGTASALNAGIKAASGDFICWLSSDDMFLPKKVELQVAYMKQVGALISSTNFRLMNEYNVLTSSTLGFDNTDYLAFLKVMRRSCVINGCTVMMDKKLIQKIGYFDELLPSTQDYDFWLRVLCSDIKFYHYNQPLTHYRVHSEMGSQIRKSSIGKEVKLVSKRYKRKMTQQIVQRIKNM